MAYVFAQISKYIITILFMVYTLDCFAVFRYKHDYERKSIYSRQNIYRIVIHIIASLTLYLQYKELNILVLLLMSEVVLIFTIFIYSRIYPNANRLIVNNMCMLLTIGLIILSRISANKAMRQFYIMTVALIITSIIPFIIKKITILDRFKWIYTAFGIISLMIVLLFSNSVYGSKINITIASYTFQPSEYVKLVFVFALACFLYNKPDTKTVIISAIIAGVHVLLLVASKDLGSAIIFFIVYFSILYVATKNILYYLFGFISGAIGSFIGYKLFSHVRVRILAYRDPFSTIDNAGYQIAQSLFAIGTGGWFGMGLGQGAPNTIPVVAADFIFSAIIEEMGALFGLALVLVCLSCFVMFLNIAMRFKDMFYKLIAVGLAVEYGFQVFLTIGGVTKFIPLTGVTLPLVSYGGTSIVVTLCLFAIIQGLYISKDNSNSSININNNNANTNVINNSNIVIKEPIFTNDNEINYINNNKANLLLPDEEDIMFEKAVAEGLKLANDNPDDYRLDNIDDYE